MIHINENSCPICRGNLKYYDSVSRIVRTKNRFKKYITIRRLKCVNCGKIHRELPPFIIPYKQYQSDIISGVINGIITSDTIDYEDYPCEAIMTHWKNTIKFNVKWF